MDGGEVVSLPDDPGKDGGCEMSGQGGHAPPTLWAKHSLAQTQPRELSLVDAIMSKASR